MRVCYLKNGSIDEIFLENTNVSISRTGLAKFRFKLKKQKAITFDLWTSKKGTIKFNFSDGQISDWISIEKIDDDTINDIKAEHCSFHLEHCDRGLYYLSLNKKDENIKILISTKGYIKTMLVENDQQRS